MQLSKSQAHYIKAVYELSLVRGSVRVIDIANQLSVSKASASLAVSRLTSKGLLFRDIQRRVFLTQIGEREVIRLLDKFELLLWLLVTVLGVNSEAAKQDACSMTYLLSKESICAICRFIKKEAYERSLCIRCPVTSQVCCQSVSG